MCKVSVIVPVYNVQEYIRECLDSIVNQSFTSYEVVIVDDGTTDSSIRIAQQYVDQYEHWRMIHQKNGGLSSARNAGIREARGEYLCFIDSDDTVEPEYLQRLYNAVVKFDGDLAIADFHEVDEQGIDIHREKGQELYQPGLVERVAILDALTYVGDCHFATAVVVAWNKLIRTEVMRQVFFREGVLHEDEFCIMPLLLACRKVVWISDDLYAYRQRKGSIMQDERNALRHLQVLDAFEERIRLSATVGNEQLTCKLKKAYFWDIEVWYYFMRTKYNLSWHKLYGYFTRRMWKALVRYGDVWWTRKRLEYLVFALAPELYLKYLYR